MTSIGILLAFMLTQAQKFQVAGQIVSTTRTAFHNVHIESIDRRFVKHTDVDRDGSFVFKKIPEGLYKLIISGKGRREEVRTIEVRPAFVDARARVVVKIELSDSVVSGDQYKVDVTALRIPQKAIDELQRATDAGGDIENARRHLQQAIEIAPDFTEALNNLGTIYYHDKNFAMAARLFERGVRANPNSFAAQVNLGGALISLGNYARALAENLKAIEMRPDDSLAQSQTGQALFYLHRYEEAMVHLQKAKELDPASFTLPGLFIAEIYRSRGDVAASIFEYKNFLKVHPGHSQTEFVQRELRELENQN
jgi:tetratricopeptide (TPR) repeat protein